MLNLIQPKAIFSKPLCSRSFNYKLVCVNKCFRVWQNNSGRYLPLIKIRHCLNLKQMPLITFPGVNYQINKINKIHCVLDTI